MDERERLEHEDWPLEARYETRRATALEIQKVKNSYYRRRKGKHIQDRKENGTV
jgi:hypothetical protein